MYKSKLKLKRRTNAYTYVTQRDVALTISKMLSAKVRILGLRVKKGSG